MFKHILIPTDGSRTAAKAITAGVKLAKEMGARVTGFYAQEPLPMHIHGEGYIADKELVAEFEKRAGEFAAKCIAEVGDAAKAAGVPFEGVVVKSQSPHKAIVDAAKKQECDAIFIASHGHKGLTGLVLGSVTQKVLVNSETPVLVFR
jgi:nucleotide-binding universal stress UspA family protein